jgi:hypothetical protein
MQTPQLCVVLILELIAVLIVLRHLHVVAAQLRVQALRADLWSEAMLLFFFRRAILRGMRRYP